MEDQFEFNYVPSGGRSSNMRKISKKVEPKGEAKLQSSSNGFDLLEELLLDAKPPKQKPSASVLAKQPSNSHLDSKPDNMELSHPNFTVGKKNQSKLEEPATFNRSNRGSLQREDFTRSNRGSLEREDYTRSNRGSLQRQKDKQEMREHSVISVTPSLLNDDASDLSIPNSRRMRPPLSRSKSRNKDEVQIDKIPESKSVLQAEEKKAAANFETFRKDYQKADLTQPKREVTRYPALDLTPPPQPKKEENPLAARARLKFREQFEAKNEAKCAEVEQTYRRQLDSMKQNYESLLKLQQESTEKLIAELTSLIKEEKERTKEQLDAERRRYREEREAEQERAKLINKARVLQSERVLQQESQNSKQLQRTFDLVKESIKSGNSGLAVKPDSSLLQRERLRVLEAREQENEREASEWLRHMKERQLILEQRERESKLRMQSERNAIAQEKSLLQAEVLESQSREKKRRLQMQRLRKQLQGEREQNELRLKELQSLERSLGEQHRRTVRHQTQKFRAIPLMKKI